ncbi:MAG TPA: LysR family transcriptional regulator [Pseudonocardia sp.]|jgi:DNA-binding transcriptional LysR family regulator
MDLTRLRTLREFADRGTVTATAAALHRTPSAVSQQLRGLSAQVGVALTEPAGRGLRLTDAGRALVARADAVLAAAEHAEAELDAYRTRPRGRVRVALFPSGAVMLLAGLLRRVAELPGLVVECRDVDVRHHEATALLADFDVVVTHRAEQSPPADGDRVEAVHLLREPLDVALPADHRLARAPSVTLADLAAEQWICVQVGFPIDDVLNHLGDRTGTRPVVAHRINTIAITERLVAAGLGVALLPRYGTGWEHLARRPLADLRPARHIDALIRPGTAEIPTTAAVLDALRVEADSLSAQPHRAGP